MLNIVLFEPEIAENTGNIARTCVAFNAKLHLIRPYGFPFSKNDPKLKRAGANYFEHLQVSEYDSYDEFINSIEEEYDIYYLSRYGVNTPNSCNFKTDKDVYLMFGKESTGIDKTILLANKEKTIRVPSSVNVRSINLSNTVAMIAYEYVKQNDYDGLSLQEPHKKLF
jgi:tRNA (cytidine/uridine-2'-O-)-methyltransferase